ncbi:MAG TPA: DUF4157 domain-containing protein [Miltoncostaeaceae bacterium]|nr:DUF4157 domain-containing protein [Miltoncostaeaceae bacterium]
MSGHEHDHERGRSADVTGPVDAAPEQDPLTRAAQTMGNRAFAVLARDGDGILPGGRVHPDVEAAIAARKGGGRPLDATSRERFGAGLGDGLGDVRVHDDDDADALARSVSARAFTVGSDLFFAEGQHQPGTGEGAQLLAHELTHVVQQRGAPAGGGLTVSEPGDALESEADQAADELTG